MTKINAIEIGFEQVLDIKLDNDKHYPFNLKIDGIDILDINIINQLKGPGIYFIAEDLGNTLLYVGIWNDIKTTVNKGRFWKHIRSLTLRGLDIAKQSKSKKLLSLPTEEQIIDLFKKYNGSKGINIDLKESIEKMLTTNGSEYQLYKESVALQLSYKRAAYANHHWELFSNSNAIDNIKSHFKFYYIQLPNLKDKLSKKKLECIEKHLVEKYSPLVNEKSKNPLDFQEENSSKLDIKSIENYIQDLLMKKKCCFQ